LKGDGGQIEMQNGNFVDVARRKKDEFLKIIGH
jgi:two-component system LytT family response regulator